MFQCECSHSITYRHNLHRDQDHYIYLTICKLICSHTTALGSKGNEIFFLSLDQAKKTGALLENDDDAGHLGRIFSKWCNLSWLVRERSVTWIFQAHLFFAFAHLCYNNHNDSSSNDGNGRETKRPGHPAQPSINFETVVVVETKKIGIFIHSSCLLPKGLTFWWWSRWRLSSHQKSTHPLTHIQCIRFTLRASILLLPSIISICSVLSIFFLPIL